MPPHQPLTALLFPRVPCAPWTLIFHIPSCAQRSFGVFVISFPHADLFPCVSVFCAFFPWASCAQLLLVYPSPICDAGYRLLVYLLLSIMCSLRGGAGGAGAQHSPLVGKARLRASSPLLGAAPHYTPKPERATEHCRRRPIIHCVILAFVRGEAKGKIKQESAPDGMPILIFKEGLKNY